MNYWGPNCFYTSNYHMQMDGLIEQFHQTLKKIIYRFVPDDAYKCDKWLRPLLFPVREILQATMRFSPLDLP